MCGKVHYCMHIYCRKCDAVSYQDLSNDFIICSGYDLVNALFLYIMLCHYIFLYTNCKSCNAVRMFFTSFHIHKYRIYELLKQSRGFLGRWRNFYICFSLSLFRQLIHAYRQYWEVWPATVYGCLCLCVCFPCFLGVRVSQMNLLQLCDSKGRAFMSYLQNSNACFKLGKTEREKKR